MAPNTPVPPKITAIAEPIGRVLLLLEIPPDDENEVGCK